MRVQFDRLEPSALARELVEERVGEVLRDFPELRRDAFVVTLGVDRSVFSYTPDLFRVRVVVEDASVPVDLESAAPSLYAALSSLQQVLREQLRRGPSRSASVLATKPRSRAASSPKR